MNEFSRPWAGLDPLVHAPARLAILTVLSVVEEADFRYLLHATGLTKGNLSAHVGKLEGAGYLVVEKTFRGKIPLTICRLTPKGRDALEQYRQTMRRLLNVEDERGSNEGSRAVSGVVGAL